MFRRDLLRGVTVTGAICVAGCNGTPAETDDTTPDDDAPDEERVKIVDHALVRRNVDTDEETVAVIGELERVDDEDMIRYVELRAQFFDVHDEQLDSTTERVEDIDENGRWDFEIVAPLEGERAAAVRSYDVTVTTVL